MSSQCPNVGIEEFEEPATHSSIDGSTQRIALPVSAASRPYSTAVFWPTCHGPSISLPRHHSLTPYGSSPRRAGRPTSCRAAPLTYSSSARAASMPRVPRLTASSGSHAGAVAPSA